MSTKKREPWVPPTFEEITVSQLVEAIISAETGNLKPLKDISKGINKPEWYSSHLVFRTPNHFLITPVKVGGKWTSLEIQQ